MKKFGRIIFFVIAAVFALGIISICRANSSQPQSLAHAEEAEAVLTHPFANYLTISLPGKDENGNYVVLNKNENFRLEDNVYYIATNTSITVNLKPFEYNYREVDFNSDYFSPSITTIEIAKDLNGNYNDFFSFEDTTYYFQISTGTMFFYYTRPLTSAQVAAFSTSKCSLLSYEEDSDKITINVVRSYTLKSNLKSSLTQFNFSVSAFQSYNSVNAQVFNFCFNKPSINFANAQTPIVKFTTYRKNGYEDVGNWLKNEQSYNKLTLTFLNSIYSYTETAPLYFDINFNGFVYTFKLFIEDGGLFVEYTDKDNSENNRSLASRLVDTGAFSYKINSSDNFSMTFSYRGRYSISFYDDTYLLGAFNPNVYNASFYIADDSGELTSMFNNMYIIAQKTNENGDAGEYIVNSATENSTIMATIKNLDISNSSYSLKDVIKYISINQVLYGSSNNINYIEYYLPAGIKTEEVEAEIIESNPNRQIRIIENLEEHIKNGNFTFPATADGLYQISIYENSDIGSNRTNYTFTVITQAKSTFTVNDILYSASEDFKTEIKTFPKEIPSSDPIQFVIKYSESSSELPTTVLDKTYKNEYQVSLGNEKVEISATMAKDSITISCLGVGNLTAKISYNGGEEIEYPLNSEEGDSTVTFYEYGTYTVTLVDSMGTTTSAVFTLSKKMNTSSILLIVFSAVILVVIVTFVLISRAKPKTR